MELQDYPWTNQSLFMQHNLVREYVEGYAQDINEKYDAPRRVTLHLDIEVVRLFHEAHAGLARGVWNLSWKPMTRETSGTYHYSYVIVAVGVYEEPWIPYYEGLSAWREMWGNSVSHAETYRNPDAFGARLVLCFQFRTRSRKLFDHTRLIVPHDVLIVGYQASGFDIANKISTWCPNFGSPQQDRLKVECLLTLCL